MYTIKMINCLPIVFQDIIDYVKCSSDKLPYAIISDKSRDLAVKLGMVDPAEKDSAGLPLTCRAVSVYVTCNNCMQVCHAFNRCVSRAISA